MYVPVYICIYIYTYAFIYVYIIYIQIFIYVYMYMYTCKYVCIYIYMYMYIYICMHIYLCKYACVCINMCIYIYKYLYVCIYIYIYVIYIYILMYVSFPSWATYARGWSSPQNTFSDSTSLMFPQNPSSSPTLSEKWVSSAAGLFSRPMRSGSLYQPLQTTLTHHKYMGMPLENFAPHPHNA